MRASRRRFECSHRQHHFHSSLQDEIVRQAIRLRIGRYMIALSEHGYGPTQG
jgi:hypothetical protein